MTDYVTTEEQCRQKISGVCPGCGGELSPIETIDNSNHPTFWSGCKSCMVFTGGVPADIHKAAKKLYEEGGPTWKLYHYECPDVSQIREISYMIIDVLKLLPDSK